MFPVHLVATLLAAGGMRVGILDLDVQSPGIHLMFGLNGQDIPFTLNDFKSRLFKFICIPVVHCSDG